MKDLFTVRRSDDSAQSPWTSSSLVSIDDGTAVVHTADGDDDAMRRAGRGLRKLGITGIAFETGHFSADAKWALSRGFVTAKGGERVIWAEQADALAARARCYDWARTQAHASPEALAPEILATAAGEFIAGLSDAVTFEVVTGADLKEAGHIGCHEVGRGSDRPPAMLKLDYHPNGEDDTIAASLVGKGITFDSGGYSIKASESMFSMKFDMAGAATVAAALGLAIENGLDRRVRLYLCCAENLISGHAYKLGDILTYPNGLSVEISNTDAEGRLVLADGLLAASADKPRLILDGATLTGAAYNAVGPEYNAVFAREANLRQRYLELAERERERHWPLPLEPFHRDACPSPYADTMNSRPVKGGGPSGASNAAAFLSRFVDQDIPWVHVDLSAAFHERDTAQYAAGATGQGIRTMAAALESLTRD